MDQARRRELVDTEPTMPYTRAQQFRAMKTASYEQQCDLPQSQSKIHVSVTKKTLLEVKVRETSTRQEPLDEPAPISRERRLRNVPAPESTIAEEYEYPEYEYPEYEYPEYDSNYKLMNEFDPQPASKVSLNLGMKLQYAASSNLETNRQYSERSSKGEQSKFKSGPESAKNMLGYKRLQPSRAALEPIARRPVAEGVALGVKGRPCYESRHDRLKNEHKIARARLMAHGLEPNYQDAAAYVRRDDPKLGYDDRYVQAYGDYDI